MSGADPAAWLSEPGAIAGEITGVPVVHQYGDSEAEYAALKQSVGLVARTDLRLLRFWGRDPIRMLNGLITNDLALLSRERAVYAAMLTPKGRMISDLRVTLHPAVETELIVECSAAAFESVAAHLTKYVPPLFARWEALPWSVIGVYGPRSHDFVSQALGIAPQADEDGMVMAEHSDQRVPVVASRIAGDSGFDLFVPEEGASSLWTTLSGSGARPAGMTALETCRVEAGRPRFGADMTEENLPAEVFTATGQMERAVSFSKGCYTGQEVVVRIAHRGHVNRHLRGLRLGDGPTPPAGTPLREMGGDREIGRITTSVRSPMMGETIALAMVRREHEPGARIRVGVSEGTAVVTELPFRPG